MPKTIRFTELVKKSGEPQTVALWTKPKDNPSFLKAIRENRILTVIQKPTGTQKDFAMIGFARAVRLVYGLSKAIAQSLRGPRGWNQLSVGCGSAGP